MLDVAGQLSCRLFKNVEKQKNDYSPATEN